MGILVHPSTGEPIAGEPYSLEGWFSTIIIRCKMCDKLQTIVLVGGNPIMCPHCHTVFQCKVIYFDLEHPEATQIGVSAARGVERMKD